MLNVIEQHPKPKYLSLCLNYKICYEATTDQDSVGL